MPSPDELIHLAEHFYIIDHFLREDLKSTQVYGGVSMLGVEAKVLTEIAHNEGLTQNQLCQQYLYSKPVASDLISRLERKGLVARQRVGKVCYLHLTDLGREAAKDKQSQDLHLANQLAEAIPADLLDLHQVSQVLGSIVELLMANRHSQ